MYDSALLTFTLVHFFQCATSPVPPSGPATIKVEKIEECPDATKYSNKFDVQFSKRNRSHVMYSGCYEFPSIMDSTYILNVTAAKGSESGWKPNAYNFVGQDACHILMGHVKKMWTTIQRGFGVSETCPMSPGKYCAKDVIVPADNAFVNMPYGKYRMDVSLYIKTDPLLCVRLFVKSFAKKNPYEFH